MLKQFGQLQDTRVESTVMRFLKHFIKDPLPPLRYLNNCALRLDIGSSRPFFIRFCHLHSCRAR
jgi:hypothetical protein